MSKIKAIAFDLVGVLVRENNFQLSATERVLEKQFGNINFNEQYFDWAMRETGLSRNELNRLVDKIVLNIYEIREPNIFECLPKLKFAIATNHLSAINKWLDKSGLRLAVECVLVSADIGCEKPNADFYTKLISELDLEPEEILFVDDKSGNIKGAEAVGLSVLHYQRDKSLAEEISSRFK